MEIENIPTNENIWKIIPLVVPLERSDLLNLRLVSKDIYRVVTPHIQFSKSRFDDLVSQISDVSAKKYYDPDQLLVRWLKIEEDVKTLAEVNKNNPMFRETLIVWLTSMNEVYLSSSRSIIDSNVAGAIKYAEKNKKQHQPSFRRSMKKIGKGAGSIGCGVATIATVPLALVSLPLLLCGGGPKTGTGIIGMAAAAPFALSVKATFDLASGALEPNLRLAGKHHASKDILACIKRIRNFLDEQNAELSK